MAITPRVIADFWVWQKNQHPGSAPQWRIWLHTQTDLRVQGPEHPSTDRLCEPIPYFTTSRTFGQLHRPLQKLHCWCLVVKITSTWLPIPFANSTSRTKAEDGKQTTHAVWHWNSASWGHSIFLWKSWQEDRQARKEPNFVSGCPQGRALFFRRFPCLKDLDVLPEIVISQKSGKCPTFLTFDTH